MIWFPCRWRVFSLIHFAMSFGTSTRALSLSTNCSMKQENGGGRRGIGNFFSAYTLGTGEIV